MGAVGTKKVLLGNFLLSGRGEKFATDHGLNPQDEFAAFRDYHLANASRFADWEAAWRTWVRNAVKFAKRRPEPTRQRPTSTWTPEEIAAWQKEYRELSRQRREKRR